MSTTESPLVRVDDESYQQPLATTPLVLPHFRADCCGPCNDAVEPVFTDIAETYADDLAVAVIDAANGQAAIDQFDIDTPLTSLLVEHGTPVARFRGKPPYMELERAIERQL
jgi:thioredoxin-like negative regulator of GroEL